MNKAFEVVNFVATTRPSGKKRCRSGDACQVSLHTNKKMRLREEASFFYKSNYEIHTNKQIIHPILVAIVCSATTGITNDNLSIFLNAAIANGTKVKRLISLVIRIDPKKQANTSTKTSPRTDDTEPTNLPTSTSNTPIALRNCTTTIITKSIKSVLKSMYPIDGTAKNMIQLPVLLLCKTQFLF